MGPSGLHQGCPFGNGPGATAIAVMGPAPPVKQAAAGCTTRVLLIVIPFRVHQD